MKSFLRDRGKPDAVGRHTFAPAARFSFLATGPVRPLEPHNNDGASAWSRAVTVRTPRP